MNQFKRTAAVFFDKVLELIVQVTFMDTDEWEAFSRHLEWQACGCEPGYGSDEPEKGDYYRAVIEALSCYTNNRVVEPQTYELSSRGIIAAHFMQRITFGIETMLPETMRAVQKLFETEIEINKNDADVLKEFKALIWLYWISLNEWTDNFITFEHGRYVAWDESQANIIGRFSTKNDARAALFEHAEQI